MNKIKEKLWGFWYKVQKEEKECDEGNPTLVPYDNFDPESDATVLREAMKGIGTTEEDIVEILTKRSLEQRIEIQQKYRELYERELDEDLESDLSGVLERVILPLLKPLPLFYAEQIWKSLNNGGLDKALINILCTKDESMIKAVKESFEDKYKKNVEEVIEEKTSGNLTKILSPILSCCRDGDLSLDDLVGQLSFEDIDEDTIIRIFTSYRFSFLKKVFKAFEALNSERSLLSIIKEVCTGDSKAAIEAFFLSANDKIDFYAHALHEAMEGYGTDEDALIRIFIERCESDLGDIKERYKELYPEQDLVEQVKKETSGHYGKALLNLLAPNGE